MNISKYKISDLSYLNWWWKIVFLQYRDNGNINMNADANKPLGRKDFP